MFDFTEKHDFKRILFLHYMGIKLPSPEVEVIDFLVKYFESDDSRDEATEEVENSTRSYKKKTYKFNKDGRLIFTVIKTFVIPNQTETIEIKTPDRYIEKLFDLRLKHRGRLRMDIDSVREISIAILERKGYIFSLFND